MPLSKLTLHLLDEWHHFFEGIKKPKHISYMCVSGSVEGGTTTFLAFGNKLTMPLFAVKIYRYSNAQGKDFNEIDVLKYLSNKSHSISSSIPRLIMNLDIAGTRVIVQSILNGMPMTTCITSNGTPETSHSIHNFKLASKWLKKLYFETKLNESSQKDRLKRSGLALIGEFAEIFEMSSKERDSLQLIAEGIDDSISGGIYVQHGDFCRQNILLTGPPKASQIGVIDWTDCKRIGYPLHDLFFFLSSYFMQVRRKNGLDNIAKAFESTFFLPSPYQAIVAQCISEHCEALSIDLSHLPKLFGLFLVEQAVFEYSKMIRCVNHDTLPRFVINLAVLANKSFKEAAKQQVWIYFFRLCVEKDVFFKGDPFNIKKKVTNK